MPALIVGFLYVRKELEWQKIMQQNGVVEADIKKTEINTLNTTEVFITDSENGKKLEFATSTVATVPQISDEQIEKLLSLEFSDNKLDTTDWKTYTNKSYGFSFKYPNDWYIETDKSDFLVVRPIQRKDPNDDGGIFLTLYKNESKDIVNDYIGRGSVLVGKSYNNYTIYVFDYKLGVWDEQYMYPDQRPTWQEYIVDLGAFRIGVYEPSNDTFRAEILEQLVLSLSK